MATIAFTPQVFVDGPEPPGGCEEIGRVSRAYVSAYNRVRAQVIQVRRTERRCVVADFNGAIPASRTIASVTWRCTSPWVAKMSAPAINDREVQVTVDFQFGGFSALKCEATLDNGEIYSQAFECQVRDSPGFFENAPVSAGPFVLSVQAE